MRRAGCCPHLLCNPPLCWSLLPRTKADWLHVAATQSSADSSALSHGSKRAPAGPALLGCLAKWHGVATGRVLTASEQAHVASAIGRWLNM
ncbi:DUF4186 family protein [Siccirubricoccus soli]|uniref:DUF4186 family protein n=1 Tax=Siccirubricoccus soli TaxID=2899147 RepID=UPI003519079F